MPAEDGRAIWIVLDGVGVGALPDAAAYGDAGAATLQHVAAACGGLQLPRLEKMGLGRLADIEGVAPVAEPQGAFGRMQERSAGKDSTTGHWELAGIVLEKPFATFPDGFPAALIAEFTRLAGRPPLGNIAASGTDIIDRLGAEHLRSGRPIVYTSVDSVFQIAAHEDILPPGQLYALCRALRKIADGYKIGRVIARPFVGDERQGFRRTGRRKDFSMPPPEPTLLDRLAGAGRDVCAVGKINDLFSGRGIGRVLSSHGNQAGMADILVGLDSLKPGGLLVANLIDFDMQFGHRQDAVGFGRALEDFDHWLPQLQRQMTSSDLLIITADHGCDPTTPGTDHTREYVPLLAWQAELKEGVDLGTRESFADLAATLSEFFALDGTGCGRSFWAEIVDGRMADRGGRRR
jgi:phosphopentomutase